MFKIENYGLVVHSEFCLNPDQCYDIKTHIPWYITLILLGSTYLIVKNFI